MEKIAVYGTGVIGSCEATLTTGNGFPTVVLGHSEAGLLRCRRIMEQNWDDLIAQGLAEEQNKKAAMALTILTRNPEALAGCNFVWEAVVEDTEIKANVYRAIVKNASEDVIIASSTSSLDAEVLAGLTDIPERLLIVHPFQPAHMLPLVEVVSHSMTALESVERTCHLMERLHRQVVRLNKSVPGFLVNRLAQALFRESIYLIEGGVTSAADIDRAVKYAVGMRYASIGLLEYFDAVGFQLESTIAANVYPDLCNIKEVHKIAKEGILSGKIGQGAGQGLFDWSEKDEEDFRFRKQRPYFESIKEWNLPK